MSSILNSISSGLPQNSNGEVLNDTSVMDMLQNSEIEFNTCPAFKTNLNKFNTGFGENNDLHYKTPCSKPKLSTPLYRENYLQEFETEEEKAQARHALGLYNKGDVVALSLLTAENTNPTKLNWSEITFKELRKGDKVFAPLTSFSAVYDSSGISLTTRFKEIKAAVDQHQIQINSITQKSEFKQITSLGDMREFLEGFNNGDNLKNKLDTINQEMLRFERSGQIID